MLLQKGAHVNNRDYKGNKAVYIVAGWSSTDAIALLTEDGASINIGNNVGKTPTDTIHWYEQEAVVFMMKTVPLFGQYWTLP